MWLLAEVKPSVPPGSIVFLSPCGTSQTNMLLLHTWGQRFCITKSDLDIAIHWLPSLGYSSLPLLHLFFYISHLNPVHTPLVKASQAPCMDKESGDGIWTSNITRALWFSEESLSCRTIRRKQKKEEGSRKNHPWQNPSGTLPPAKHPLLRFLLPAQTVPPSWDQTLKQMHL